MVASWRTVRYAAVGRHCVLRSKVIRGWSTWGQLISRKAERNHLLMMRRRYYAVRRISLVLRWMISRGSILRVLSAML